MRPIIGTAVVRVPGTASRRARRWQSMTGAATPPQQDHRVLGAAVSAGGGGAHRSDAGEGSVVRSRAPHGSSSVLPPSRLSWLYALRLRSCRRGGRDAKPSIRRATLRAMRLPGRGAGHRRDGVGVVARVTWRRTDSRTALVPRRPRIGRAVIDRALRVQSLRGVRACGR